MSSCTCCLSGAEHQAEPQHGGAVDLLLRVRAPSLETTEDGVQQPYGTLGWGLATHHELFTSLLGLLQFGSRCLHSQWLRGDFMWKVSLVLGTFSPMQQLQGNRRLAHVDMQLCPRPPLPFSFPLWFWTLASGSGALTRAYLQRSLLNQRSRCFLWGFGER